MCDSAKLQMRNGSGTKGIRNEKAVEETLRRCTEENILAPFWVIHQKEVAQIMVTFIPVPINNRK